MNKRRRRTAVGVLSSLVIVVCAWLLTNALLDRQEAALFARTGSISVPEVSWTRRGPQDDRNSDQNLDAVKLEERLMVKILENWNAPASYARPHEPVEGQLNIEQAVTMARVGLSHFAAQGIVSSELLEDDFSRINASLWENRPAMMENQSSMQVRIGMELPPEYSYWVVTFDNTKMGARLTLNAVTGEIWRADVFLYQAGTMPADLDVVEMTEVYAAYLGLEGEDCIIYDQTRAIKGFGRNMLSVIAEKKKAAGYGGVSLYLSEFRSATRGLDKTMEIVVELND